MPRFNKAAYHKGMWMHGGAFSDDGTVVGVERKPSASAIDPRIVFLQKHTAALNEISAKLDALKPQVLKAAELVKRR